MPQVPGLRSCYDKVGRLIYFGRMLDKIRLHDQGQLPADYIPLLGDGQFYTLDGRCCRFLGVTYSAVRERTRQGGADEEILAWAHAQGTPRSDEECHIWNRFIAKLGWRDERSAVLPQRILNSGLTGRCVETLIDHIEYDEGRERQPGAGPLGPRMSVGPARGRLTWNWRRPDAGDRATEGSPPGRDARTDGCSERSEGEVTDGNGTAETWSGREEGEPN